MEIIILTSIGMYDKRSGWPITKPFHPLGFAIGVIYQKPRYIKEKIENRVILCIIVQIDHNIIDGAITTRVINILINYMEEGYELI